MKNNRGEIATVIAIGTLIILGISSLVSSALLKNKQTTRTKAAEDSCECVKYGDKYIYADKPGGGGCTTKYEECTPSVQTSCANKLDQVGACNPACCQSDDDCKGSANQPQPQVCGVPNGYCLSGKSCAAVEPTSKKAKYVRMCLGASCSWTFCDGKNADPSICTEDPNTATNSDPSTLCDSNEECQTFKPTSAAGVNKCINPAGKQENCPRTYSQCYGNGKAMTVHLDCTQSNTSGCVYWCESKSGGRTGCDKSDAKTFDEPSCKAAALPTVTPTSAVSQKKDGTEGSICGTKTGITCKPGFSCNRSENGICVKTSEQQPAALPLTAPPGVQCNSDLNCSKLYSSNDFSIKEENKEKIVWWYNEGNNTIFSIDECKTGERDTTRIEKYCDAEKKSSSVAAPTAAPPPGQATSNCEDPNSPNPLPCPVSYDQKDTSGRLMLVERSCPLPDQGGFCQYTCFDFNRKNIVSCWSQQQVVKVPAGQIRVIAINNFYRSIKIVKMYGTATKLFGLGTEYIESKEQNVEIGAGLTKTFTLPAPVMMNDGEIPVELRIRYVDGEKNNLTPPFKAEWKKITVVQIPY